MKIGLDIDGVLADFTTSYGYLIKELSGRNLLPEDFGPGWQPSTWYWDRALGYNTAEESEAWDVIQNTAFWLNLKTLPSVNRQFIHDLDAKHEVYFITTRPGEHARTQTQVWLIDQFNLPCPTVLISGDKGPVVKGLALDIFVDDRDKNVLAVAKASPGTAVFVLDYPYNRTPEVDANPHIHRILKLEDAIGSIN